MTATEQSGLNFDTTYVYYAAELINSELWKLTQNFWRNLYVKVQALSKPLWTTSIYQSKLKLIHLQIWWSPPSLPKTCSVTAQFKTIRPIRRRFPNQEKYVLISSLNLLDHYLIHTRWPASRTRNIRELTHTLHSRVLEICNFAIHKIAVGRSADWWLSYISPGRQWVCSVKQTTFAMSIWLMRGGMRKIRLLITTTSGGVSQVIQAGFVPVG